MLGRGSPLASPGYSSEDPEPLPQLPGTLSPLPVALTTLVLDVFPVTGGSLLCGRHKRLKRRFPAPEDSVVGAWGSEPNVQEAPPHNLV